MARKTGKGKKKQAPAREPRRSSRPVRVGLLALFGGVGLLIGTFAPAVRVDLHGTLRYWDLAGREVFVVLVAGLLILRSVPRSRQRELWWPMLLLWGALALPFLEPVLFPRRRGFFGRIRDAVADTLSNVATDLAFSFDMVHWQWGAPVFVAGALCASTAGVLAYR
ncbi:MAG: hypothetical protein GY711_23405 [bacterium]|nr:hypothetical protein [bacterium]